MVIDILKENDLRNSRITTPFNPIRGEGCGGKRIKLMITADGQSVMIPAEMENEKTVEFIRAHGSVEETARHLLPGEPTPEELDSAMNGICDALCRIWIHYDFPFWAASYVKIKRKGGGDDVSFMLNRPQRRLVEKFEEMRRDNRPIRLILLKARQWGGSTCAQLYMAWLQLVHCKGLNSLIIAHQGAGSDEIKDMFDRMMNAYPDYLLHDTAETAQASVKKTSGVGKSGTIMRVNLRNCKIKIGTAERPDSCRGGDYNLVHLSEVGIWKATQGKRPEDIVRSACSGILLKPMTMIVLESTANGTGNFFHREYIAAKEGESQFEPMFVPWFEIDQYSLPFSDYRRKEEFAEKLFENRNDSRETPRAQSGAYLWKLWEMGATLEAIHWYVEERSKYSDHAAMAAEYPSDDMEAFANSGRIVFAREAVERLRPGCMPPLLRGEVDTPLVPGIPDLSKVEFHPDSNGSLSIWEMPENSSVSRISDRYLTVMDIGGRSPRADWTVIAVFDRLFMADGGGPAIVAQWRGHADLDVVALKAAKIAAFYNNSLLVIESNTIETRSPGSIFEGYQMPYVMSQLRDLYPNLYTRRQSPEEISEGRPRKYGFHTNVQTKPMVISTLVKAVRDHLYAERDENALCEMLQYEQRSNGSYGAIAGCHDDILMTRAIGLYVCFNEMDPPRIIKPQSRKDNDRRHRAASEASF